MKPHSLSRLHQVSDVGSKLRQSPTPRIQPIPKTPRNSALSQSLASSVDLSTMTPISVPNSPSSRQLFGLTQVSDYKPLNLDLDNFNQLRAERLVDLADSFQTSVKKSLTSTRPSASVLRDTPREETHAGDLRMDPVKLHRTWNANLKRLQKELSVLKTDVGNSKHFEEEIERLRKENFELKQHKDTTLALIERETSKLTMNSEWWESLFADDGTVIRKAGELKRLAEGQSDEILQLRSELRRKDREIMQLIREREVDRVNYTSSMGQLGKLAEFVQHSAIVSLELAAGITQNLQCPKCAKIMTNPQHLQPCGHTFCAQCVNRDGSHHVTCEICGEEEVSASASRILWIMTNKMKRRNKLATEIENCLPELKGVVEFCGVESGTIPLFTDEDSMGAIADEEMTGANAEQLSQENTDESPHSDIEATGEPDSPAQRAGNDDQDIPIVSQEEETSEFGTTN